MLKRTGLIMLVVLIITALVAVESAIEETPAYHGTVMQVSGVWFLQSEGNLFGLEFGDLVDAEFNPLALAVGDSISVKGTLGETVLEVVELEKAGIVYTIAEAEQEVSSGYQVNSSKCIGCRLCVKNCPVGAISMHNGKAVIDVNKCIQCGICANGNGKDWQGCPVGAISNK